MVPKHRICVAAFFFVAALCCNAQTNPSPRICLPSDLEPALHFYRAFDSQAVVALNYRNTSDGACRLRPMGVNGTAQYLRPVTIDPGQTVHTAFRWSMEDGGETKCQSLKFVATQPSPSVSALTPTLVPANCNSWMPDEYAVGPFVPNWPAAKVEPAPLPRAPVLVAPKDTYDEGEIVELRLETGDQSAPYRKCPALYEFIREMSDPKDRESGAELREIHQSVVNPANSCMAYSPWSGAWRGPAGEYPVEVEPNGVRGLHTLGKRIVSVAELAGMGADGELRLVFSNPVTLTIVDPVTIDRNWGKTQAGVRADLTLDKLSYPLGENIPLHLAFENVSSDGPVYGRPVEQWRCAFDHLLSPDIDYTVRVEKEDGAKPQVFGLRSYGVSGGPCGTFPPKQLDQGKIIAVEDTLFDHRLLQSETGVYRITLTWTAYKDSLGSGGGFSGPAGSEKRRPFATVTSAPLILTITPPDYLP